MSLLNFLKVDNVEARRKIDYYVYTDGACSSNGMSDAKAGFGIYFGPNDPRNVSRKITGKQTNNTAELIAIIEVYKIIKEDIETNKRIVIVSDSIYAIRCCGEYGKKMSLKNYKKGKLGKEYPIPNAKLVKQGYELYKNISNVTFMHVEAHTGKSDIHSLGNDGADKLANMAIGYNNCPYNKDNLKIYLNVPYSKKDDAKKKGAKWDAIKKKWYTYDNNPKKQFLLENFSL